MEWICSGKEFQVDGAETEKEVRIRVGRILNYDFSIKNVLSNTPVKKNSTISQHFVELWAWVQWHLFTLTARFLCHSVKCGTEGGSAAVPKIAFWTWSIKYVVETRNIKMCSTNFWKYIICAVGFRLNMRSWQIKIMSKVYNLPVILVRWHNKISQFSLKERWKLHVHSTMFQLLGLRSSKPHRSSARGPWWETSVPQILSSP